MGLCYKRDLFMVFNKSIEAIEEEIAEIKRRERQIKSKIDKTMARTGMVQPTEKMRLERNNLLLEISNWERRLDIARNKRQRLAPEREAR